MGMQFTEILDEFKVLYATEGNHHCRPGWVQMDCPFCGLEQGKYHLGYNINGRYVNCWQCGYHSVVSALAELTGQPPRVCFDLVGGLDFGKLAKFKPRGKLEVPAGVAPMTKPHRRYLKHRGFDAHKLERIWGVQGIGLSDRLSWRLFIPIHFQGEVVSWTTRTIGERGTRYISAKPEQERMAHKDLLYGEDYCRNVVIVHEGPFDVWRTGPGAVCTFGTDYTKAQVERLVKYPVRVVCFDSEPTAQRMARKLVAELAVFPGETFLVTLDSKDPGSASDAEILELRRRFLETAA